MWRRGFWLVFTCLVLGFQGPAFVRGLRPQTTEVFDFLQDWVSARNFFDGQPIYGPQEEALARHLGSRRNPSDRRDRFFNEVNAHPPTSVLLVLPIAFLDYPTAFLVWSLLSLAAGAISLWLVVRGVQLPWSPWSYVPFVGLLLVCNPFRQQMHEGQWSLIVLALLTGTWAAARSQRFALAGTLLATATAIKLVPGFLFLYFLWRRQGRTLLAGLVVLALWTGLTVTVLGFEAYRTYILEIIPSLNIQHDSWANASLTGFWSKLFAPPNDRFQREPLWLNPALARLGAWSSSLAVVSVWLAALRRSRETDKGANNRNAFDLGFACTLVAMLLVAPITWEHYFLWLLVPLAVLWQRLPSTGTERACFWLVVALLWIQPRWLWELAIPGGWLEGTAKPWQTLTVLSVQLYALVGLFALHVRALRMHQTPLR